ncbi:MAG: hypothetical protein MRY78_20830 [Saprospiraceae bacterium]|nr:hypothetical protein [Saprospiraceae bacterium]
MIHKKYLVIKKYLIFLSLLFPFSLLAQTITVSEEVNLRSDKKYELIGLLGQNTLLFRDHTYSYEIQAFDESMQMVWEKELELDDRQAKVLGVQQIEDQFILLYRFREKSKTIVKANKYNASAELVDSVTIKNFGFLFSTPDFEVIRSEDRSKILLYHVEKQRYVKAIAFDVPSMTVMWEKAIEPEDMNYGLEWQQILVDDSGNMHFVLNKDNYRSNRKVHYYQIFQFFGMDEKVREFNVSLEGKLTFDVKFDVDNRNNQLVAAGLYGDRYRTKAKGFFYLRIPFEDYGNHTLKFHEFDLETIGTFLDKKVKRNKGLLELVMDDVVLRSDGGVLAIIEKAKLLERRAGTIGRSFNDPFVRTMTDYYFEELYVVSMHPNGDLHWGTILHKKQYAQDEESIYASYFLFKTPTALRFIFNDEIKYENTVSEYVLVGDGSYVRNSVLNTEDLKIRLRFKDAVQINSRILLIPSEMRSRIRIIKLEY